MWGLEGRKVHSICVLLGAVHPAPQDQQSMAEGREGTKAPLKAPLQDSSHELQEIAEFGGRAFSPGFNHTQSRESRGRWLAGQVPLPPHSRLLIPGPEPGPRLS